VGRRAAGVWRSGVRWDGCGGTVCRAHGRATLRVGAGWACAGGASRRPGRVPGRGSPARGRRTLRGGPPFAGGPARRLQPCAGRCASARHTARKRSALCLGHCVAFRRPPGALHVGPAHAKRALHVARTQQGGAPPRARAPRGSSPRAGDVAWQPTVRRGAARWPGVCREALNVCPARDKIALHVGRRSATRRSAVSPGLFAARRLPGDAERPPGARRPTSRAQALIRCTAPCSAFLPCPAGARARGARPGVGVCPGRGGANPHPSRRPALRMRPVTSHRGPPTAPRSRGQVRPGVSGGHYSRAHGSQHVR